MMHPLEKKELTSSSEDSKDETEPSLNYAIQLPAKLFADSNFFTNQILEDYPKFDKHEIATKKLLGKGCFGVVYEVAGVDLMPGDQGESDGAKKAKHLENRKSIAVNCTRSEQEEGGGDDRYAIKFLQKDLFSNTKKCQQGIVDMAIETYFLSALEHPNIIKMKAYSAAGMYHPECFLVMERLYDTLDKRMKRWQRRDLMCQWPMSMARNWKKKKNYLQLERLVAAKGVASALQYLHGKKIIYRNLKPENIGFDINGDVKLFDFGLARELKEKDKVGNDLYKLTGQTGKIRYMAPEVYKEEPYNQLSDVYVFAIVLWEMLTLYTVYDYYNVKMYEDYVIKKGYRPMVREEWPVRIKQLIRDCLSSYLFERPSAQKIFRILEMEVAAFLKENNMNLLSLLENTPRQMLLGKQTAYRRLQLKLSRAAQVRRFSQS